MADRAHHFRMLLRHLRMTLMRLWWCIVPPSAVALPSIEPGEITHPSQLCACACGFEAPASAHSPACSWLRSMCRTCDGTGWCPGCMGDGTSAEGTVVS